MSKKDKIKILFIERATDGTVGGSHRCLYNLVSTIDREKFESHVGFYQANSYVEKLRNIGVAVHLINWKPVSDGNVLIRKIRNWYRLIYKHRKELLEIIIQNKIDLIVINNTIAGCNGIVSLCSKLRLPIIAYERGYLEYLGSDISLSSRIYASIAVSHAIKKNMESQKYSANTHVIYDGIDIDGQMNCLERNIKRDIGIPDNSIVIGIIGNVREWKGQEYFVKAFMSLGGKYDNIYGLVIGGYGPEDMKYVNHIKSISGGSELEKRLIYLGYRDDVPELLKIMDVFIHASITPEPFGMVILEAMLSNVPVIATNLGGPVESLENGNCGILVPPRNENAIIEGVEKYLNDSIFRKEIVARAHKRIIDEFDLRRTVGLVEDLFQEARINSRRSYMGQ